MRSWIISLALVLVGACGGKQDSLASKALTKVLTENTQEADLAALAALPPFKRVVCLGESLTEIVRALGDSARIVGIAKTHPLFPEWKVEKVGYQGTMRPQNILRLKPDLVLTEEGILPEEVRLRLSDAKVKILELRPGYTFEAHRQFIRQIAIILKHTEEGKKLLAQADKQYSQLSALLKQRPSKDSVQVLYLHARGPQAFFVAGTTTPMHALIRLAGGKNLATEVEGLERINQEDLLQYNPTFIVMSRKSFESISLRLYEAPYLLNTLAYRTGRVVVVNEYELMNPGLTYLSTALTLAKQFYEQQVFAPLPNAGMPLPNAGNPLEAPNTGNPIAPKIETRKQTQVEIIKED